MLKNHEITKESSAERRADTCGARNRDAQRCEVPDRPLPFFIPDREEATGTPVAGARVALFANASDQELAKQDAATPAETGADGVFVADYRFNMYSSVGFFGADRCNERIKTLVVVVRHPRYRERRVTLAANELKVRPTSDLLTFEGVLRTIEISRDLERDLAVVLPQTPRRYRVTSEELTNASRFETPKQSVCAGRCSMS